MYFAKLGLECSRSKPSKARLYSYVWRLTSCAGLCLAVGIANLASAQDGGSQPIMSPFHIAKHPDNYLGKLISWRNGYCFIDKPTYVCIGKNLPFEVVLQQDIAAGTAKFMIDENCGDINGTERNPVTNCAFSFDFVADRFEIIKSDYFIGEKLQQNKRIVRFMAQSLKPSR